MFIKLTATSSGGKYKTLVAVEHVAGVMEVGTGGAQILFRSGDFLPVADDFNEVEAKIIKAQNGEGYNVFS